jgi:hypothetical protein
MQQDSMDQAVDAIAEFVKAISGKDYTTMKGNDLFMPEIAAATLRAYVEAFDLEVRAMISGEEKPLRLLAARTVYERMSEHAAEDVATLFSGARAAMDQEGDE